MNEDLAVQYLESEYQRSPLPYRAYLEALESVFDFSIINSFLDLGCNNGGLISGINRRYPRVKLNGVDYFEWSKKYADDSVKDKINILDLSKPQLNVERYDIVNCTEVGEHIEAEAEDVFIDNLLRYTGNILILSWSDEISHGNDQHQNPRSKDYIIRKLEQKGITYWKSATDSLSRALFENSRIVGHHWWSQFIMVFRRVDFFVSCEEYFIQSINTDNEAHRERFLEPRLSTLSLQKSFLYLTQTIKTIACLQKSITILRASDGDYFFLRKIPTGSAQPGKRALTKPYDQMDMVLFRNLLWCNDLITVSIEKPAHFDWRKYIWYEQIFKLFSLVGLKLDTGYTDNFLLNKFKRAFDRLLLPLLVRDFLLRGLTVLFSRRKGLDYKSKLLSIINKTYIPMECVYALVATKWIFRNYKNQIGIITGEPKLQLIKLLMERDEYREFIGMDYFLDYIAIPQIGAADQVDLIARSVGEQIKNRPTKIYLVAAGSAKIALLPLIKYYTDAIFIDVGCGIDALAGVICQDRPYFADWINFRIKTFNYESVDFMDQGNPKWSKSEYRTVLLD